MKSRKKKCFLLWGDQNLPGNRIFRLNKNLTPANELKGIVLANSRNDALKKIIKKFRGYQIMPDESGWMDNKLFVEEKSSLLIQ